MSRKFPSVVLLICLLAVCILPVAGAVTYDTTGGGRGSIAMQSTVSTGLKGNLTGQSLYTSDLFGRGDIAFMNTVALTDQIQAEHAATVENGRLMGGSAASQLWCGSESEPTYSLPCGGVEEPTDAFCMEVVATAGKYDLTSGSAYTSTTMGSPRFTNTSSTVSLDQYYAVQGNGSIRSGVGYALETWHTRDEFKAMNRLVGRDLAFNSHFVFGK